MSRADLEAALAGTARLDGGLVLTDPGGFREKAVDPLVRLAVFGGDEETRDAARRAIRSAAETLGAVPASIQGLYDAVAAGRAGAFTVPAHNLRGLVYDEARALFRAAKALDAGAFVFEISISEMGYCFIRPAEFSACVLGAAIREGWRGPVFLQGDHFQYVPAAHAKDPAAETERLKRMTREAVDAAWFNIDVDPSTLVDPSRPTLKEQQRDNFERAAEMTAFIRGIQPPGVEISVGGEIGEVGTANSTVAEFEAFFEGYRERFDGRPISKMSVQSGTAHGGVVLPDGRRREATIDFSVLRDITAACRRRGLAGTVQHGASTLPAELLGEFPKHGAVEIHLATEFQRIVLDHPAFPAGLRREMEAWVEETRPPEWRPEATRAQNWERCAKRTWGRFKRETWDLDARVRGTIMETLESRFRDTLTRLNAAGTRATVDAHVRPVAAARPVETGA